MNIVHYKAHGTSKIAFCLVDTLNTVSSLYARELVKNQSDFTISNLYIKGYDVFQGTSEDQLLHYVNALGFTHAVVFATGTEFINGMAFFEAVESLAKKKFFIAGHVLDRKDAYYELHHQCYVVNLNVYNMLGQPQVGKQELGVQHTQDAPWRSYDNWHDDYTPKSISGGDHVKQYSHKCHGWNILKIAFEKDLPVLVFDESMRNNKRHHYPESNKDWLESLQWIYYRERYCSTEHVHTQNNEWDDDLPGPVQQLMIPASGILYFHLLDPTKTNTVIFYDYNIRALEYWKDNAPKLDNVNYKFVHFDVLGNELNLEEFLDPSLPTIINLSNLFCYEGTTMLSSLEYRVYKENQLLIKIKNLLPDAVLNFTMRAATGFTEQVIKGHISSFEITDISTLRRPTWHTTSWLDS